MKPLLENSFLIEVPGPETCYVYVLRLCNVYIILSILKQEARKPADFWGLIHIHKENGDWT